MGRSDSIDPSVDDDGSRADSSKQAAFITDLDEDRAPSRAPATCIEDVVIDYESLIHAPQPPPNCKTEVVLNHVSDGILEDWKHDQWNVYFLSPLSVDICNDFFWYFFLKELALVRVQLGDPVAAATQVKLEPSQLHSRAQEIMFRRVSDNYMSLFWKALLVGLRIQL